MGLVLMEQSIIERDRRRRRIERARLQSRRRERKSPDWRFGRWAQARRPVRDKFSWRQ